MLPKLDVPIHELKLVSSGKTIRFRPFLVKEQKLFLMASESDEPKEVVNVIRQVLKNLNSWLKKITLIFRWVFVQDYRIKILIP